MGDERERSVVDQFDDSCLAAWIAFGLQRGLLRPLEVHGGARPRPSKRSLTMSPELIDAVGAAMQQGRNPK